MLNPPFGAPTGRFILILILILFLEAGYRGASRSAIYNHWQ